MLLIFILNKHMKSRSTKQKKLLQEETKQFSSFFTAEELYKKVQKKDPKLGTATVYRFLTTLTREGRIHSYSCNRRKLYSISNKSHSHFSCEECGKTEHLNITSLDFIQNKVEGSISHFQIDITGICDKCSKKTTPQKS